MGMFVWGAKEEIAVSSKGFVKYSHQTYQDHLHVRIDDIYVGAP